MRNRQTDYYGAAAPPGGRDLPGRILAWVDVVPRMGGKPPQTPYERQFSLPQLPDYERNFIELVFLPEEKPTGLLLVLFVWRILSHLVLREFGALKGIIEVVDQVLQVYSGPGYNLLIPKIKHFPKMNISCQGTPRYNHD